jgi:uncharacterized protein YggU (UPF0235/DUF167 family)
MTAASGHGGALPIRVAGGCVIVRVRLTPKSSLDAVGEITPTADGPPLAMRVRALPADGAANLAAARLLARWLDVPARNVRLSAGGKSRVKAFAVAGDASGLAALIARKLDPVPAQ